jgi:prepilin-type N-terminal cleavage/methylation domain-containing protein/prepilin-type processing-associated H-X9-DG protein
MIHIRHSSQSGHRAFSLTELLVVVAILLIVATVVMIGTNLMYSESLRVKCQHNLEQVWGACQMYATGNQGCYPRAWDIHTARRWYEILPASGYIDPDVVIGCPLEPAPVTRESEVPPQLSEPIIAGLNWLADKQTQQEDPPRGYWDAVDLGGKSSRKPNWAVTGMALMSYLGYGCTDKYPEQYADVVDRAMTFLVLSQQTDPSDPTAGYWRDQRLPDANTSYDEQFKVIGYGHAICTMAAGMAASMTGDADCRAAAQKGLNYLLARIGEDSGAFGYGSLANDISVSGWSFQAIDACRKAGIQVPDDKMAQLKLGLANMVPPGHDYKTPYRFLPEVDFHGASENDYACRPAREVSMSLISRLLMGERPGSTRNYSTPEGRCAGQIWWLTEADISIDGKNMGSTGTYHYLARRNRSHKFLYFYYYTTLVMSLLGGEHWENWTKPWPSPPPHITRTNPIFPDELLFHQVQLEGHPHYGSWHDRLNASGEVVDPEGLCTFGPDGGRAFSTAMALMTLEAGIPGHWGEASMVSGRCSYGYSIHLGKDARTPAADTIVLMDYEHWTISRGVKLEDGTLDPARNDPPTHIVPRHGGHANCMMADGHVEALEPHRITEGNWTLEAGD